MSYDMGTDRVRLEEQRALYESIGLDRQPDPGSRPALLIIDMCAGLTEFEDSPGYIDMREAIKHLNELTRLMRGRGLPVVFTIPSYTAPHFGDAGRFGDKVGSVIADFTKGSATTAIDSRLDVAEGDYVIEKQYPSGFYGTSLQSLLTSLGTDTTIVTGNSTSGCVRATVVDAVSGGFHVTIPEECVADRVHLSHEVNLFDMNAKYGNVLPVGDVVTYVETLPSAT